MTPDMLSVLAYLRRWDHAWTCNIPTSNSPWINAEEIWEDAMEFDKPGQPAVGEPWPPDMYYAGVDRVTKALYGLFELSLVDREPPDNEDQQDIWRLRK